MRIEHGDDRSFDVTVGIDFSTTLAAVVEHPSFKSAIADLVDDVYYQQFSTDIGGNTQTFANNVMEAFLRSGSREGAEDFISEDSLENFTAVDAYEEEVIGDESHDGLRGGMVAALVSAFPDIDVAEVHEAVDQVLKDACVAGIEAADKSVPMDAVHRHADVEMCFIPDYGDLGLDDMWIQHYGSSSRYDTVTPDENFARFLRFVNVSSDDYVAAIREQHGVDLREQPDAAEFEGSDGDYAYRRAHQRHLAWANFSVEADPNRPALLSTDEVVTVVDNASYGGVPVFACLMPLRAFIERDHSKPMTLKGGGFVGIHDFVNGSGYIETFKGDFTVPADALKQWVVASNKGYGIDSVYGIVESYLRVKIEEAEPTAEVESEATGMRP